VLLQEYHAREAAFTAKYEVYFQLHQLIEAHKKDFEALDAAIRSAGSDAERDRWVLLGRLLQGCWVGARRSVAWHRQLAERERRARAHIL